MDEGIDKQRVLSAILHPDMTPGGSEPPPDIEPPCAEARPWPHPASSSMGMRISKIQLDRFMTGPPPCVIVLDAAKG